MQAPTFTIDAPDGVALFVRRWAPDEPPRAAIQIVHGLSEHSGRYARLAGALTGAGYVVHAGDLRGHGHTARSPDALGFFAARDGWRRCLDDVTLIRDRLAAEHPGLPVVLIGHSMGSFMAQQVIAEQGETLAGAVLSGSAGKPPAMAAAGRLIARAERLRLGAHGRSQVLRALAFGAYNKAFEPARTRSDWLSRDEAEVDAYIADPLCGAAPTTQLWIDLLDAIGHIARPALQARVPTSLPIYVIAGGRDPVSANTKSLSQLLSAYERAGLTGVTSRFYPDARHELFNETNREEVTRDLLGWLDGVVRPGR